MNTFGRKTDLMQTGEKMLGTDLKYVLSGGTWMGIGTVFSSLISLAVAVACANLFSKTSYGIYQYVISNVSLLGLFTLPGMKTAISYSSAKNQDGSFLAILRTKVRWGLIGSALSLCVAVYYFMHGNSVLGGAFIVAAFFIPIWDTPGNYVGYLQGKKAFGLMTLYETIAQFIAAAVLIGTLLLTKNLTLILIAYFGSWTVVRMYFLKRTLKKIPPNNIINPTGIQYGTHLTIMSAAGTLSSNIDKLLLWHLLGPAVVAVYTFSLAIPLRSAGTFAIINRLAFPKMVSQKIETIQSTLTKKILLLCVVSTLGAITYILVAPYIFTIFFSQYIEAIPFTRLAAVLIALQPFALYATSLSAHVKHRSLYIQNLTTPVVRITLFAILIPLFHLNGAVAALIGTECFEIIITYILFKRARTDIPPKDVVFSQAGI